VTVSSGGKFVASAFLPGGKRVYVGTWRSETDAALARDRVVLHLRLDRRLNFPTKARKHGPASQKELVAEARRRAKSTKSSPYFGVIWDSTRGRWGSWIGRRSGEKGRFIARFDEASDAAVAYDRVAKRLFGSDTLLNFPKRRLEPATLEQMQQWARSLWKKKKATSKYRGVYWSEGRGKWVAQIGHEGRHRSLGLFESEIHAAEAYDHAAKRLKGKRANLNFP
jgi:hypothetical protein